MQAPVRRRHSALVRVTHWILAASIFGLLVSGIAILVAHPRLYWGETGAVGAPSLLDLPLPFVFGHSGWGRYLHFLSAWICVLTGLVYVLAGLASRHFRDDLLPSSEELTWRSVRRALTTRLRLRSMSPREPEFWRYNVVQQLVYLAVIFLLLPMMIWTGLAMSPAVTSVFPSLVESFGGQQSARTLHFFAAVIVALFLLVHLAMLFADGFASRMRAMITGRVDVRKEPS